MLHHQWPLEQELCFVFPCSGKGIEQTGDHVNHISGRNTIPGKGDMCVMLHCATNTTQELCDITYTFPLLCIPAGNVIHMLPLSALFPMGFTTRPMSCVLCFGTSLSQESFH